MVTICIFMLRDVMRKVQRMYDIPSHGTRHTNPNEKEELKRLMEYLAEDKLQEFKLNRDGNEDIEPVSDLMIQGAGYGDTAKAYRNFKSERRQAKFAGGGDAGAPSDVEAVALVGDEEHIKDGEEDDDSESVEGGVTREENDLGSFGVVEEDLGVGDDEFSDLANQFLALAMDVYNDSE